MIRAGVFIGVDQTGHLRRLADAASGARRMHAWALGQGMADRTHAKLVTDEHGQKVSPDLVYDAIKEIVDGPGVDQLIVYFAGHGVNINRSEHWLLTDAPVRTSAAVNVSGSVELARYCGIQHVVFISDACRVAPEGIQAQNVRGVDVFPNDGAGDRAKPVDQFFACLLGRTAAELKDPAAAAGHYTALYTAAMLDALQGTRPDVLEPAQPADDGSRYVRMRRLESYLEAEVPRRVKALRLENKVNQDPDAIITSEVSWLARIAATGRRPFAARRGADEAPSVAPGGETPRMREVDGAAAPPPPLPPVIAVPAPAADARAVAREMVRSAAAGDQAALGERLEKARTAGVAGVEQLATTTDRLAAPYGPDHFESECGIKVRGARLVDVFAPRARFQLLGGQGDLLRIDHVDRPAASLLLCFEGGTGAVIPALPGFLATLTFDDGELADVAYEPSANTWRWDLYEQRASEVRALRAVAASASQQGRFRLDQADAVNVAQKMQYAKGVDPTLAVYAGYAYHDLQATERIKEMSRYLRDDVGATLFDLALLGRALMGKGVAPDDAVVPFVPLLSQGWMLLKAHRVKLHSALDGLEGHLRDSLWSLYDAAGVRQVKDALQTGEVR